MAQPAAVPRARGPDAGVARLRLGGRAHPRAPVAAAPRGAGGAHVGFARLVLLGDLGVAPRLALVVRRLPGLVPGQTLSGSLEQQQPGDPQDGDEQPARGDTEGDELFGQLGAGDGDTQPGDHQRGLEHHLRHRRGRVATVVHPRRVVELDDDHELWRLHREHAGEHRIVVPRRVPDAALDATHGAALSTNREACEVGIGCGATVDHALEHRAHRGRDRGWHEASYRARLMMVEHPTVRVADLANQRRLEQAAAVRDRAIGSGELHGCDRDFVAHRERGRRLLRPLVRWPQRPRRFGRIRHPGWRPEAGIPQRFVLLARREATRELHDPDVARKANHVAERERVGLVHVRDRAAVDRVLATFRAHHLVEPRLA